ncbi:cell filamentation protein Fic [Tannerella sp. oral taxon 808]|nr:cell filamentation protein Fic [Tannerella sp. oral taxon 808]
MRYLHERNEWWRFRYDTEAIDTLLRNVHDRQAHLSADVGKMWNEMQDDLTLSSLSDELVHSSAIEGEQLDLTQVRSSIARRLGIDTAGLVPSSRYVDGVVEMLLDATQHHDRSLTDERLFGWHAALFPTGYSGPYRIEVARYRTGQMQVVSGPMGRERVHYVAPAPDRLPTEMARFLAWVNAPAECEDGVLKAAIAHLWFVSIHPFDDGNGRIARAITDLLLSRAEGSSRRFYSMSSSIMQHRRDYYDVLERTQRGDGDITDWLRWFLACLSETIDTVLEMIPAIFHKHHFFYTHRGTAMNERQRLLIGRLFDGLEGKLTAAKWAKLAKCSRAEAETDIADLVSKGILREDQSARHPSYVVNDRS